MHLFSSINYQSRRPGFFMGKFLDYRFSFNGKEKDNETYGDGNVYDYGFRVYNPRLGKFLSVDPLTSSYPWYTPYQFAGNKPIVAIDLDGLEEYFVHEITFKNSYGHTVLFRVDYVKVMPSSTVDPRPGFVAKMADIDVKRNPNQLKGVMNNYNRGMAQKASDDGRILNYNGVRISNMHRNEPMNNSPASLFMLQSATIKFGENKGRNCDEVRAQFDAPANAAQKESLDNLALGLINDPNFKVNVVGYASPKPTDLGGEYNTTEVEHNNQLAMERAEGGKSYLLDYIKNTLKVENFDTSRISTSNGGVIDAGANAQTIRFNPN
ncbi:MAG: hypothetical protein CFE21_21705 [Bacteroidetes bacterium B1(2017)]|nr:MAG: hypothetical protein CFE21_21705 [Bacteroidetes bacterium B1(2017)]